VDFVDNSDSSGYVGTYGQANTYDTDAEAAVTVPVAGLLSHFGVRTGALTNGVTLAVTVDKNGADTSVTCTVTASTCSTATTVAFAAGDTISVHLAKSGAGSIRNVRWSATLGS
jgi:hypothetical protein